MVNESENNLLWHPNSVTREDREKINYQRGVCLWFTGLSGSGKSTIANELERHLNHSGYRTYLLDGDNIRLGLNKDLGFSEKDRTENIRRIGEIAKLFVDAGIIVLTAFISPYRIDRQNVRDLLSPGDFIEIFVNADISVCESRDPKGLYKKARAGKINNFTGISAPYEKPLKPELNLINADEGDIIQNTGKILNFLYERNIIKNT
ncbi:MAG: adenylyl-sulfate kinase [Candidatus Cloacimonetes bacterium]|nr:adenylyl-sulfate kinase [Candidatus Cloacimonadota bacterium]MCF8315119.1 adenylyl-sulfate kinase [Ignavibacteriales bacterium]MCF8435885.1 adenylyl-sulfate kinase [Ignavibacteriales bacterium]